MINSLTAIAGRERVRILLLADAVLLVAVGDGASVVRLAILRNLKHRLALRLTVGGNVVAGNSLPPDSHKRHGQEAQNDS